MKTFFILILTIAVSTVFARQASTPNQPPAAESTKMDSGVIKNAIPEKMPSKADTTKAEKTAKGGKNSNVTMSPDKGIGPITEVKLGPIDPKIADKGKTLFGSICTACHSLDKKMVGPPLRDVTQRRTPEYVMNMILNTPEMQEKDPEVKKLITEYKVLMAIPKLNQDQARALLEYLRQADQDKPKK